MNKVTTLIIILIVGAGSLFFLLAPSSNMIPKQLLAKMDKCVDDKCLIIYLGYGHSKKRQCSIRKRNKNRSVIQKVKALKKWGTNTTMVIGGEHYRILELKAKRYPFPIFIDYNYSFFDQYRESSSPVIIAYNQDGKVLNTRRLR